MLGVIVLAEGENLLKLIHDDQEVSSGRPVGQRLLGKKMQAASMRIFIGSDVDGWKRNPQNFKTYVNKDELGDNPADSYDSQDFGYVRAEAILGVVVAPDPEVRAQPRRAAAGFHHRLLTNIC